MVICFDTMCCADFWPWVYRAGVREREGAVPARSGLPIQRGDAWVTLERAGAVGARLPVFHNQLETVAACNEAFRGPASCSFDVLDARRRIHVELAAALAQQELDGAKISLVNLGVLLKFGPERILPLASPPGVPPLVFGGYLPRKDLEVLAAGFGLFAAFAEAAPVEGQHLLLETRQARRGHDGYFSNLLVRGCGMLDEKD